MNEEAEKPSPEEGVIGLMYLQDQSKGVESRENLGISHNIGGNNNAFSRSNNNSKVGSISNKIGNSVSNGKSISFS